MWTQSDYTSIQTKAYREPILNFWALLFYILMVQIKQYNRLVVNQELPIIVSSEFAALNKQQKRLKLVSERLL